MFENASPPEVMYTVPSAIGALLALVLLYLSVKDEVRRRQKSVNGLLRLDMQKAIVTAMGLFVALLCLTQIGINAMMTPANPNILTDPTTAVTSLRNAELFVTVDVTLIFLVLYRFIQRMSVNREMDRAEPVPHHHHNRRATDTIPPVVPHG